MRLFLSFLILLSGLSLAQEVNSPDPVSTLDSLLFAGNVEQLENSLRSGNYPDEIKGDYDNIVRVLKNLQEKDKNGFIEQAKSLKHKYEEPYAGQYAARVYSRFEISAQKGDADAAIKDFYIARFFKNRFVASVKNDIDARYRKAQELSKTGDFRSSVAECEEIENAIKNNPYFTAEYMEMIRSSRKNALEKYKVQETERKKWEVDEVNDYQFRIYAGGTMFYNPSPKDVEYSFKTSVLTFDVPVTLHTTLGFGYTAAAGYKITNNLVVMASFASGVINYKNIETNGFTSKTDMSLIFSDLYLSFHYYLRNKVGVCPYAGLGLGYNNTTRERLEFNADSYYLGSQQHTNMTFVLDGNEYSSTSLTAVLGFDYVPSKDSRVVYNLNFSMMKPSSYDMLISKYTFAFGFNIGILL